MNRIVQDLIVSAFGFVASMATGVALYLVEEHLGFALYSFTLWFVIPGGAMGSGFVAAGGWYLGSLLFNHRPTPLLLLNMVLASVTTFFTIYWLGYASMDIDGKLVSDIMPFSEYMDFVLQHQSMEILVHGASKGTTGELGRWGYLTAALQIIGFALGGAVVYGHLITKPYCEQCHKFLKAKAKQVRYSADSKSFSAMVENLASLFTDNRLQEALDAHGKFGEAKTPKDGFLMSRLERKQCPACNINWLKFSSQKLVGNEWKEIKELEFTQLHEGELHP